MSKKIGEKEIRENNQLIVKGKVNEMQLRMGKFVRFAVNKSTIKFEINFGALHYFSMFTLVPKVETVGLINLCSDNRLVFFGDWDNAFLYRVKKDLKMLQREYDAGTFYILCSGDEDKNEQGDEFGSYHAIGIAKWKFHELADVIKETSVDRNFVRVPDFFNGRYWVLRVYPKYRGKVNIRDKPWLKDVLYSKTKRQNNKPMYDFMRKWYGAEDIPRSYNGRFDRFSRVRLIKYPTTQGWWKDLAFWRKK